MKRKCFVLAISFILICTMLLSLVACLPNDDNSDGGNDGDSTNIFELEQHAINMIVSATESQIIIDLSTNEGLGSGTVEILAVKAYEYYGTDNYSGLSQNKITDNKSRKIGEYVTGESKTITIDRYTDVSYDRLYDKYYAVQNDKIIKGPIYATEIEGVSDLKPELDLKSKKGILGENSTYFEDLNCSYVTLNFDFEGLIYPNEMYEDGEIVELAHPDNAISFESNGKTYYFNRNKIEAFDKTIKDYYDQKAHITAILYANNRNIRPDTFPQYMTYLPYSLDGKLLSINTSNNSGFEYYIAMMEFLASRYSGPSLDSGFIANYIIGNEIDYSGDYFKISDKKESIDVYMEEYSRLLRLSNLAVKKYNSNITVNTSFTQAWAKPGTTEETRVDYAPKTMIEWLNHKTKLEGDYDWGFAPHCYTYGLAQAYIFLNDTIHGRNAGMTNDFNTTSKLTFSNLELLGDFLNQENMKFNGNTRNIWLTESGVSSTFDTTDDRSAQAGSIAAVWYKVSQLDFIKSFSYYRMFDHKDEGDVVRFGVLDRNKLPKPSYNVLKYIDTQYSEIVAEDYLEHMSYVNSQNVELSFKNGDITSYMDLLDVFETGWITAEEFDWAKACPVTAETVYEYEDKIDLSGIIFESRSYIYDGTPKSIEVVGTLPDGVSVEYDKEATLTEIGSITVLATFKKDDEVVGRRQATLTIGNMATNKSVYNFGEKIFVTSNRTGLTIGSDAWIGLYKKGAIPGDTSKGDFSYYYFYPNQYSDSFKRTVCLQDYKNEDAEISFNNLPAGDYVLYYFENGGYSYFESIEIRVLPENHSNQTVDLSNVSFSGKTFANDGTQHSLEIEGTLPDGVTVEYLNNSADQVGSYECVAIFKYNDIEIERRYAIMTISFLGDKKLAMNQTEYYVGEDIIVAAQAPDSTNPKVWWVGLYLETDEYSTHESIYWYYVKDETHVSGVEYNLKLHASHNPSRGEYANLPAGNYKLVLFNTSGYSVEEEIHFVIKEYSFDGVTGDIALEKTQFNLNEAINSTITTTDGTAFTFKLALIANKDTSILSNALRTLEVVNGQTADIMKGSINVDKDFPTIIAGQYKLVLLVTKGEFSNVLAEKEIQYGTNEEQPAAGSIYSNKTTYGVGEAIYITAYAPEVEYWWIGIYDASIDTISADTPSIFWYDASKTASGQPFIIQNGDLGGGTPAPNGKVLPAGEYQVVLFNTDGYTVETKINITIA